MTVNSTPRLLSHLTQQIDMSFAVLRIVSVLATIACSLSTFQVAVLGQTAEAHFLNQNPAPANTAPGAVLFNGHAGRAGVVGTPTDGRAWLIGSAFGQPAASDLFWDDVPDEFTEYTLGEIPSLLALQGGAVVFDVRSEELGSGAVFSFRFDSATPIPQGQVRLDPVTGRFSYIPAPADRLPFNILITANRDGKTDVQLVEIQPRPVLPQEEDLVRPGHAMPAEDSSAYIVRSEILSDAPELFNGNMRATREATVSGKVVIIENGNPNRLWPSYDSVLDLKSLTICAEQIIVRSPWRLPSTRVRLFARVVRFEGTGRITDAYEVQTVDGDREWLTPHALRAIVAYAKDLYLYGYYQRTRSLLADYEDKFAALEESPQWASVDDASQLEFGQINGEISELLHRLDSNLDYFGHPGGWVPNLSFEANLGFFSSEAESAIRIFYLAWWLGNVATNLQQKVDGIANSRAQLAVDFTSLTNELSVMEARLTDLEGKSSLTESNIVRLQAELMHRVDELRRQAERAAAKAAKKKKKNAWRKVAKQVGNIMAVSPVGTPLVNAIGAGLSLAADIHQPKDLLHLDSERLLTVAAAFKKGAFKNSVSSIKDTLRPLDPGRIGRNGWSNYVHGLKDLHQDLSQQLRTNRARLKPTEAADTDVQATLAQIKAENPELNQRLGDAQADGLIDQIAGAAAELKRLNSEVTDALQRMANLTDEIQRHVLAVDSMNRDASALNAILDHRAIVHLKEMERRAKERLLKVHYYLAKAYEYRFLEPYPGELNLNPIFEDMVRIAQAGQSGGGFLSAADFQSLKALYDNELAAVTFAVIERFQQNPSARSAPVTLVLSASELAALNSGEPVRINLVERYRVPVGEEDMRINEIDLNSFTVAVHGSMQPNATMSLRLTHSGASKVRSGTNNFYFRHDQQSDVSPFSWEVRYDSNTGSKTPILPSPADESLLRYLLTLRGVAPTPANLMLFARPGMWSDLNLVRTDWPRRLANYTITNLTINVSYDYRPKPNNLVALDVFPSDSRVAPYVIVDRMDQRGRQDGVGRFYRTYPRGATVSFTAPPVFGIWRFDRWVDAFGNNLPGGLGASSSVTLTLNENLAVQARYVNTDSDEDGLPDDFERRFFRNLAQGPNDDSDRDGWGNFLEFLNETSPSKKDPGGISRFAKAKGNFAGLFFEPDAVRYGRSGFFTVKLSDRGSYSIGLTLAGKRYSGSGELDLTGNDSIVIARRGTNALAVSWHVDLDGGDVITGTVSDDNWLASLAGDRATYHKLTNSAPQEGRYTLIFPGDSGASDSPQGDGYVTLTVGRDGMVTAAGTLADGTRVSQRVPLSKRGEWPFYAATKSGQALGWKSFENRPGDDLHGALSWTKLPSAKRRYYPDGFDISTETTGSRYHPPSGTNGVLDFTSGEIALTGGDLVGTFLAAVELTPNGRVLDPATGNVIATIAQKTGIVSGKAVSLGSGKVIRFKGAVHQKGEYASGFFLGTEEPGRVMLNR